MPNYKRSNNKIKNINPQNNNIYNKSNYNDDQKTNNNLNNNYITQINELKRQLKDEKEKNQRLINENNNLREKINKLNNELNQTKIFKQKLENDLAQKNIEIQKLLSKKNTNEEYFDLSSIKQDDKIIGINFVSMGRNDIGHYNLICTKRDLFVKVEERLYKNFPQFTEYETYFEVNGKRIKRFKTLEQNNIKNNDIISIFIVE